MKKLYIIFAGAALLSFASCGDEYNEPTDNVLDGIWFMETLYNYNGSVRNTVILEYPSFISVRDQMIIFFTNARYDSSFYYLEKEGNLQITRINDTVTRIVSAPERDSEGNVISDESGNIKYITFLDVRVEMPTSFTIDPDGHTAVFASYEFENNKLIFKKSKDNSPANLAQEYVFRRPNAEEPKEEPEEPGDE